MELAGIGKIRLDYAEIGWNRFEQAGIRLIWLDLRTDMQNVMTIGTSGRVRHSGLG